MIRSAMAELLSSQAHYFNSDIREKRLMPAGPDHAQIAAAKGVSDYFDLLYQHHFTERSIQWNTNENVMLYARYAEAVLAGGFVVTPPLFGALSDVYLPEYSEGIELGLKGRFANGRVEFNAALYDVDFTDFQTSSFDRQTNVFITTSSPVITAAHRRRARRGQTRSRSSSESVRSNGGRHGWGCYSPTPGAIIRYL